MAKKRATQIPTFNPNQTLKSIRENSLNPVIQRLYAVETVIESEIEPVIKGVYNNVRFDENASKLYFEKVGKSDPAAPLPDTVIDLSSIIPQFAGINVKGYTTSTIHNMSGSGEVKNTSNVKFEDADITKDSDDYANVKYKWQEIVPAYQKDQTVSIPNGTTGPASGPYTSLEVVGDGAKEYFTYTSLGGKAGTVRINMPLIPKQQTATINTKPNMVDKVFTKIKITGNVGGSIIDGDELQIDLPTGGGTGFSVGYFQGFFNSTDDLDQLSPLSLAIDRSSAYVLTEITNITVYMLYMYKGESEDPKWKPVTTKPPLIFNDLTPGSVNQGIISIKGNPNISVSSTGELDLDKLQNPDGQINYYMGIYNTLDEIKALPDPVEDKSFAMVRNSAANNGFLPYSYRKEPSVTGTLDWNLTPALGHLMSITGTGTDPQHYKPIYGIKNSQAKVSSQGVLVFPQFPKGTVRMAVTGTSTTPSSTLEVRSIRFPLGGADVKLETISNTNVATIQPAQRVLEKYTDDWGAAHQTDDYLGKIYYDKSTGKWMGMTKKTTVFPQQDWTPIAHSNMSVEVMDQTYRYPRMSPQAVPVPATNVTTGDSTRWNYSGTTYVEAGDECIPPDMRVKNCGAFIKTDVKDTADFPTGKETRVQTAFADNGTGLTYMRAWDKDNNVWKEWVRTSYSIDDFKKHEADPAAHNTTHMFYKVMSMEFKWNFIASDGILTRTEVFTITDSYGSSRPGLERLTVPYSGNYRISGRMHFQGYKENPENLPAGAWRITLIRVLEGTTTSTDVGTWECKNPANKKAFSSFRFSQDNVSLNTRDQIQFKLQWMGNENELAKAAPQLRAMGTRSYLVVEDMGTSSGTLSSNAFLQLLGRTLDRGDVATHTHLGGVDEDKTPVRTYASKLDTTYTTMTKV